MSRSVPRYLKRGGRNFLFPFPLKISVKTKKKVFTSFDVQFTPQNQVKTKKGLHVFCRPIYPPKSSEDQKKVFTSFDVQFTPQNVVRTKKKKASRPQMFCFHCSADWRYISAYTLIINKLRCFNNLRYFHKTYNTLADPLRTL